MTGTCQAKGRREPTSSDMTIPSPGTARSPAIGAGCLAAKSIVRDRGPSLVAMRPFGSPDATSGEKNAKGAESRPCRGRRNEALSGPLHDRLPSHYILWALAGSRVVDISPHTGPKCHPFAVGAAGLDPVISSMRPAMR